MIVEKFISNAFNYFIFQQRQYTREKIAKKYLIKKNLIQTTQERKQQYYKNINED
jgi:hypothetical protein